MLVCCKFECPTTHTPPLMYIICLFAIESRNKHLIFPSDFNDIPCITPSKFSMAENKTRANHHTHKNNLIANLYIHCERLRQHEPNEKQITNTEGQGKQRWSLVEDVSCCFRADGKVGTQQRSHSEAQREGDADHSLGMTKSKFFL